MAKTTRPSAIDYAIKGVNQFAGKINLRKQPDERMRLLMKTASQNSNKLNQGGLNMKENKSINIRVIDAITFCQLIDEYGLFHEAFTDLLETEKDPFKTIIILKKLSHREHCYVPRKIKAFYNKYRFIIDTIEQNASIQSFSFYNYDYRYGRYEVLFKSNKFYQYLLANIDDIDKILFVLMRLKSLGFEQFELDENFDFSDEIHRVYTSRSNNQHVTYLDNLEVVPEYNLGVVSYKSNGSNYKIDLTCSYNGHVSSKKISLNSLTFDSKRLPKKLQFEEIHKKIIYLQVSRQQEYTAIRNSIDLSVGVQDLGYSINRFNETVTRMQSVDSKEQVLDVLRNMQQNLNQIQTLSAAYNQSIIEGSSYITQELLQEEVKKYVRRREDLKIDLC